MTNQTKQSVVELRNAKLEFVDAKRRMEKARLAYERSKGRLGRAYKACERMSDMFGLLGGL